MVSVVGVSADEEVRREQTGSCGSDLHVINEGKEGTSASK